MSKITFNNNGATIAASVENGAITFENGKQYTLSKRYGENGISGFYIADGGKTYSLLKPDFLSNREALIAITEAQPKKEKSAITRKKEIKDYNTFRIAEASAERIASIFIGAVQHIAVTLEADGAKMLSVLDGIDLAAGALADDTEKERINAIANAEIAQLMEDEKRKADEARKAQAQAKIAQLKALGLTADELAELLK